MSIEGNPKKLPAPLNSYINALSRSCNPNTDKMVVEIVKLAFDPHPSKAREDQEKQIISLNHSSPETTFLTYPLAVVETIFIECLCVGDTRGAQSLACLNKSFNENMKMIARKHETRPLQPLSTSQNRLIKVKPFIPDKRADKIFRILNVFLIWSRDVKMNFFLANNPQEAYAMDLKKYFSVIANDFSSALLPDTSACFILNHLLIGINHFLAQEFPGESIQFSYPPIIADEISMVSQLDLFYRMEALFDAAGEFVIHRFGGCSIIDPDFKIRYQDTKTHVTHTMDILPHTCINYAFYQLHEQKAQAIVFENCLFERHSDMFPFLINVCRYFPVKNAKKGDVICYFNKGILTHFGYMENSDTVRSKWNQLKLVLSHPIKFVPEDYGRKFLILRPTGATENKPWEFDSEAMGSNPIRGHSKDRFFKLKFNGMNAGSKSFSKHMTLCNRSFILYGYQDGPKIPPLMDAKDSNAVVQQRK